VRCKDGWIGLCIFTPQQWDDFANMIGRPDLVGDDRFNSMGGRGRNRARTIGDRPWLEQHARRDLRLGGLFPVPVAYVGNRRRLTWTTSCGACVRREQRLPATAFAVHVPRGAADTGLRPVAGRDERPLDGVRARPPRLDRSAATLSWPRSADV
jgi:hypothetical protein